jgi:1-aminocyclopropane-1-carboxylate deaminase
MSFPYRKTPIDEIREGFLEGAGVRLFIKREDLNHPEIAGNKWWKLKYNIEEAHDLNCETLLTFGGAYSNHIYATASAAYANGFKSIGIIRGEETLPLNSTLSFAKFKGMQLHYVSREEYRQKTEEEYLKKLRKQFGHFYLIPEGGSNDLAVKGCAEFATNLLSELHFDYVCLPVGTGGTMAGIIHGMEDKIRVIGFSSLKGGSFLEEEIERFLQPGLRNWEIKTEYHFGGYAKQAKEVAAFINEQKTKHDLPLDEIYTAKMMMGIYEEVSKGNFKRDSTILAIHTGGLQGNY